MNAKETACWNDQRIMELATYHETKGMIRQIECIDQVMSRFAEFKMLVKRGSFTIEELQNQVFTKYGIITPPQQAFNLKDILLHTDEMYKELQRREQDNGQKNKEK